MWFKKLYLKFRYKLILLKLSKASPHKANRKLTTELLNLLSESYFKHYKPSNGLGIIIDTRYLNIELLIQKVKEAIRIVKQNQPITSSFDIAEEQSISVDRFLTSSNGYYIDVMKNINMFRTCCLELSDLLAESDNAEFGVQNHNIRMLTKLFINIKEVTTKLIETSI